MSLHPVLCRVASRRSASRGMTLLEVLVAFAIVAVAVPVLYRAASSGVRAAGLVAERQGAAQVAQSVMSLREGVAEGGWNEEGQSGVYRWRVSSEPYGEAVASTGGPLRLHAISIAVTWGDAAQGSTLLVSTLLPQLKPRASP